MAKTRPIGETFDLNGRTYEVRKCKQWYSCQGCAFHDHGHPSRLCYENDASLMDNTGECNGLVREDKTYVYFARVKR